MSKKSFLIPLIVVFFLGAVSIGVYRVFFVKMIRIPSGGMSNTILPGDQLVVHRLLGSVSRGDIVLFQYPGNNESYLGRVIGLPGESIQLRGKLVYINGRVLNEERVIVEPERNGYDQLTPLSVEGRGPYSVYYTRRVSDDEELNDLGDIGVTAPFQIPADNYFILGDNRDNSSDSRERGATPRNLIWGKPSIIYFSVTMPDQNAIRTERILKRVE